MLERIRRCTGHLLAWAEYVLGPAAADGLGEWGVGPSMGENKGEEGERARVGFRLAVGREGGAGPSVREEEG